MSSAAKLPRDILYESNFAAQNFPSFLILTSRETIHSLHPLAGISCVRVSAVVSVSFLLVNNIGDEGHIVTTGG